MTQLQSHFFLELRRELLGEGLYGVSLQMTQLVQHMRVRLIKLGQTSHG
jgi:hypothetical protein